MFLIVTDSYDLAGHMPTDAEKMSRAEAWARHLFGLIPEQMLQKSFDRAFRKHSGSYQVTAYDLKDAYEEINAEQVTLKSQMPQTGHERQVYCYNYANHLKGKPEILIMIPDVTDGDVIVPCGGCRPEEYWETRAAICERKKTVLHAV